MVRGLFHSLRKAESPLESAAGKSLDKKKPVHVHVNKKHRGSSDHDEGGGGGGHESDDTLWLFSFNDMLFNLLLFFIVMYSISQIDEEKFQKVQEALSGEKKPKLIKDDETKEGVIVGPRNGTLDAKQLGQSGGEAGGDKSAAIASAIRFMLDRKDKADVKLSKGAGGEKEKPEEKKEKSKYLSGTNVPLPMTLVFSHTEFFMPGTAELSAKGKENLRQLALEIGRVEKLGLADIEVHTEFGKELLSNLKNRTELSNLRIATQRAGVIFENFVIQGVPHKKVASAAYADGRPLVLTENMTARQKEEFAKSNERVVVVLKKEKTQ